MICCYTQNGDPQSREGYSYSDADWAGDYRKSIPGYLLELGGAAGRVRSRPVLLCPQLKPEHTALSSVAQEAVWTTDARYLATQRTSHTNSDS